MLSPIISLFIVFGLNLCSSSIFVTNPSSSVISYPNKHPNSVTIIPANDNSKDTVNEDNESLDQILFKSITTVWTMAQSIWPQPVGSHYVFWNTHSGSIMCIVPSDIFTIGAHLLYKSRENIGRLYTDVISNYNKPISIRTVLIAKNLIQSINNIITDQQKITYQKTVVINLNSILFTNYFTDELNSHKSGGLSGIPIMVAKVLLSEAGTILNYIPFSSRRNTNDEIFTQIFNLTSEESKNLIVFGDPEELIKITKIAVKGLMHNFNLSNDVMGRVMQRAFSLNGISSMTLTELGITSLQQINNDLFPSNAVDQMLNMAF